MELFIEIIFCMDYCRSSQFRREETKTSPSSHHSYLRGKSLSYQHPGRRCHQHECQAFNIQAFNFIWCSPACVATQRWIRMFLGVIVIVKFMLLWKATIHAFEAAKSFLLRNVFIIFRRRICSLGSARVLSVLLQPRGFTGRFGNLWSIAMNFLLLQVLHRWCRASLYSSQGYGCHRHHDVRYMPTSLFFKVDNNTPGLSHDPQGGVGTVPEHSSSRLHTPSMHVLQGGAQRRTNWTLGYCAVYYDIASVSHDPLQSSTLALAH